MFPTAVGITWYSVLRLPEAEAFPSTYAPTPMSTPIDDPERQPLLSPQQLNVDNPEASGSVAATDPTDDLATDADVLRPEVERKTYPWTVLWYTILVVAGTLILVLFIKGFIDAGDVDVSLLCLAHDTG